MDNDGLRDLFVANGISKDLTDQDFLNYIANDEIKRSVITDEGVDYAKLIEYIPSEPIANFAFRQDKPMQFVSCAEEWGLGQESFSNGSAYGDLDNDGDLDMIVNNVNAGAFVYENNGQHNFIGVVLQGAGENTGAIGSRVTIHTSDQIQVSEAIPMRGFQSSVDPRLLFGIGDIKTVDSVVVIWPNGHRSVSTAVCLEPVH